MRVFVAVDITDEMRRKLSDLEKNFEGEDFDIKLVEPENLHITLKFLGEVKENDVNEIKNIIKNVCKGFKPFKVSVKGLGFFGSEKYIRVLWFDICEGKDELVKLMGKLDDTLGYIRKETGSMVPHLTIGRVKSGRNREKLLKKIHSLSDVNIGEFVVKEIKLKESILTKDGPIYHDVEVFKLGKDE